MFLLITGGSCSGKSAYAEERTGQLDGSEKLYFATMEVYDDESRERVRRHRAMRAGKGFETVECPRDLPESFAAVRRRRAPVILLECLSNLVANEMFRDGTMVPRETVVPKVIAEVAALRELAAHLVIVTNDIFEDGGLYEESTLNYIRALGEINTALGQRADETWEVVCGIPVRCGG